MAAPHLETIQVNRPVRWLQPDESVERERPDRSIQPHPDLSGRVAPVVRMPPTKPAPSKKLDCEDVPAIPDMAEGPQKKRKTGKIRKRYPRIKQISADEPSPTSEYGHSSLTIPSRSARRRARRTPDCSAPSIYPTNAGQQCSPAKCSRPRPCCKIGPIVVTCPGAGNE